VKKCTYQPGKDFTKYFKDSNPEAVDLLSHLLVFDPKKGWSAE